MSIIIRLQNLPLSAKSADIRKYFGGIRIPDGGVHILGGEKGDAFIAFNSDEDARVAMQKDGGRIKDSRIRLYLSSHKEMQHEVEKITKGSISDLSSQEPFNLARASPEYSRHGSFERSYSRSRSPYRYKKWSDDISGNHNQHHQRSRSPVDYDSRHRSPSHNRRSVSFRTSPPPQSSQSPKPRVASNYVQRMRSVSPKLSTYSYSSYELNTEKSREDFAHDDYVHIKETPSPTSEIQAELERRITEAIEKNSAMMSVGSFQQQEISMPNSGIAHGSRLHSSEPSFLEQTVSREIMKTDMHFPTIPAFLNNNLQPFPDPQYQLNPTLTLHHNVQRISPSINLHPETLKAKTIIKGQRINDKFYLTLSGLNPFWNYRQIQMMLKGMYAPQNNIRWEVDNNGYKTGTAFIKLLNKRDFKKILNKSTIFFHDQQITVTECPEFLHLRYFGDSVYDMEHRMLQNNDLCYVLKGLPFSCTNDDVLTFFQGYEVADIVVLYDKHNKATGTGYVSFKNRKDFEEAIAQNGKRIGHRYIEMLPVSATNMDAARKQCLNSQPFESNSMFLHGEKSSSSTRTLCAIITGLPFFTSVNALLAFFVQSGFKPNAIHTTQNKVNGKTRCDGRALIEFTNFRDFDLALKLHGNTFKDSIICVKQILYDEMLKILDTQKAKHYFETPEHVTAPSHVPEKVPYLWEPPDATESEDDKMNVSNNSYVEDQYLLSNKNENSVIQRNFEPLVVSTVDDMKNINPFPAKRFLRKKNISARVKQLIHIKTETESEINAKNLNNNVSREPIKFNVNKQIISSKTAETFDPTRNTEEKFKLSKLSPIKEIHQLTFKKDVKCSSSSSKIANMKCRSPDKRKQASPERILYKKRRNLQDDMHSTKSGSRTVACFRNFEKDSRQDYDRIPNFYQNYSLDSMHSKRDLRFEDRSQQCVVQLSNVSPDVRNDDFVQFLHGFDYYKDSVIRRYAYEEPTGDVRVTFINRQEAELAIRSLKGCHLKGIRIDMCIV